MAFSQRFFAEPFYIQVYSHDCCISRIFAYGDKLTLEASQHSNVDHVISASFDILAQYCMVHLPDPSQVDIFPDIRFPFVSVDDYSLFSELQSSAVFSGRYIPAAWHVYGRESKVSAVIDAFNRLIMP